MCAHRQPGAARRLLDRERTLFPDRKVDVDAGTKRDAHTTAGGEPDAIQVTRILHRVEARGEGRLRPAGCGQRRAAGGEEARRADELRVVVRLSRVRDRRGPRESAPDVELAEAAGYVL